MTDQTRPSGSGEDDDDQSLHRALSELEKYATELWQRYQNVGPGNMNAGDYDPIDQSAAQCLTLLARAGDARITAAIEQLRKLLRTCACTPQGLSFITGEAGLVPRRDQHQQVEDALASIRDFLDRG